MCANACEDKAGNLIYEVVCHVHLAELWSAFLESPFEWRCIRNANKNFLGLMVADSSALAICSEKFSAECQELDDARILEITSKDSVDGDKVMWALRHHEFSARTVLKILQLLLYKKHVYGWHDDAGKTVNNVSWLRRRGAIKRILEVLGVRGVTPRNPDLWVHEVGFSMLVDLNAPRYLRQRCGQLLMSCLKYHQVLTPSEKIICLEVLHVVTRHEIELLISDNIIECMLRAVVNDEVYPTVQHAQCQLVKRLLDYGRSKQELYKSIIDRLRVNHVIGSLLRFLCKHGPKGNPDFEVLDTITELLSLKKKFVCQGVESAITACFEFSCGRERLMRHQGFDILAVRRLLTAVEAMLGEASGILHMSERLMNQIILHWRAFDDFSSCRLSCWRICGSLAMHGKWGQWLRSERVCSLMLKDMVFLRVFSTLSVEMKKDHVISFLSVIGSIVLYDHDEICLVVQEVVFAMENWCNEVQVQLAACLFFKKLYWNSDYIFQAHQHQACLKVVKSMESHINHRSMQEAAFGALFSLLRCPEAIMCGRDVVLHGVCSALETHADSQYLKFYGSKIRTLLDSGWQSGEAMRHVFSIDASWYVLSGAQQVMWKPLSWKEHETFEKVLLSGQLELVYDWEYVDHSTREIRKMTYRVELNERGGRQQNLCTGTVRALRRQIESMSC